MSEPGIHRLKSFSERREKKGLKSLKRKKKNKKENEVDFPDGSPSCWRVVGES